VRLAIMDELRWHSMRCTEGCARSIEVSRTDKFGGGQTGHHGAVERKEKRGGVLGSCRDGSEDVFKFMRVLQRAISCHPSQDS